MNTIIGNKTIGQKLRHNKTAMLGCCIILIAIFTGTFAYFLAPDGSPNANRMVVEIGGQKPGSAVCFLKTPTRNVNETGFFRQLIGGKAEGFTYIPIVSWQQNNDSIVINRFIDEGFTEQEVYATHEVSEVECKTFWLGTDKFGRDILSRLIVGVRISLSVGLIAVVISITIGIVLGLLAGYYGKKTDALITWLINVVWSIPTLLLVFAITLALGKGFWQVFIAVGLTLWVNTARIIRAQVLTVKEMDYVEAAKALGYSDARIMFKHILPNILGPVVVVAAANFATAIIIEAGLSFLGVGVQPPQPSWGLMIKENYTFIITQNPVLAIAPGICIMLLVLAFNLLGNGLRDALDVKN